MSGTDGIKHILKINEVGLKVKVAIALKMLSAIWFMLHDNVPYRDYSPDIVSADA